MAEREVRLAYITYHDDEGIPYNAMQGASVDTADFGEGEEERLDGLGAFTDSPDVPQEDAVKAYLGDAPEVDTESGLEHEGPPDDVPEEEDEALQDEASGYGDTRTGAERAADLEGDGEPAPQQRPEDAQQLPENTGSTPPSAEASSLSDQEIDQLSGTQLDEACAQSGIDTSQGGSLSNGAMSAEEKRQALKAANAA